MGGGRGARGERARIRRPLSHLPSPLSHLPLFVRSFARRSSPHKRYPAPGFRSACVPDSDFDIFQTEDGYVAVTNEVRREILAALAKKDRQLPELVKLTKKAKPTLSSVHMRELLASKLVEELAHPTDKRRKIYRLKGRRIGSSNLPVDQLRSAVRSYAGGGRLAGLASALVAIAAAPASTPDGTLRAQAARLGELHAASLFASHGRECVTALAALLEREGLARPLKLDLEALSIEVELERQGDETGADDARMAILLVAFCDGLIAGRAGADARTRVVGREGRRVTMALPAF